MSYTGDRERLMQWTVEGHIPQALHERVETHPRFAEAAHALSSGMLAAAQEDKAIDGIAKDLGRSVAAQWAVTLHLTGGLTLPRLKQICAASGLLSPGRARAVLLFLRYLGLVETVADRQAGKPAQYAPTAELQRAWNRITRVRLEAASIIEPAARIILERLDEPEFIERMNFHFGEGVAAAAAAVDRDTPFMRVILHRHAGMQIVHRMMLSAEPGDDFPPRRPIAVPVASMARQLRVSRTHIKRLFGEAERAGLMTPAEGNAVAFTEEMRASVRYLLSGIFIGQLLCAAKTARDLLAPEEPEARSAIAV